jgi:hypothetical protein
VKGFVTKNIKPIISALTSILVLSRLTLACNNKEEVSERFALI